MNLGTFFGAILAVIGCLVMMLCWACTIFAWTLDLNFVPIAAFFSAIPFIVGFFLLLIGRAIFKSSKQNRPAPQESDKTDESASS